MVRKLSVVNQSLPNFSTKLELFQLNLYLTSLQPLTKQDSFS